MENYIKINKINRFKIFDVFYACGELKILTKGKNPIKRIAFNGETPKVHKCRQKYTKIYTFDMSTYQKEIVLNINGVSVKTSVNKFIDVKGEIIMTTVTKDQDDYIIQWIEYYKHLGVSRFMIYDNSCKKTLGTLLDKYVKDKTVLLFDFSNIAYRLKRLLAQPVQQNHTLHAFKNAKYIGMFDIDEYLNPQKSYTSIDMLFSELLKKYKVKYSKLAGFSFQNRFFYNPKKDKDTHYNHLKIPFSSVTTTNWFRKKMFINPANVTSFTVHNLSTSNGKDLRVPEKECFFNHYRYLGHPARRGGRCKNKNTSILRHIKWLDSVD